MSEKDDNRMVREADYYDSILDKIQNNISMLNTIDEQRRNIGNDEKAICK